MKKLITLSLLCIALFSGKSHAQIFWTENFGTCSTTGGVGTYTGPNGTWTESVTTGSTYSNVWYVSGTERGHVTGACGDDCASGTGSGLEATLHVGSSAAIGGDIGAAYFSGSGSSALDATTDKMAVSPVINCTGRSGITLSFYFIENGDATNDDGSVYYYNGTAWSLLANTPKTSLCSSGQGQWDHFSIALPASANGNPNVKIGFRWVNNNDRTGTDPSFAVDSVSLSTSGSSTGVAVSFTMSDSTVCQDSCTTLTNTSTGTIDSITWRPTGGTVASPHASPATACFTTPGTQNVKLLVYHGGSVDSLVLPIFVRPTPHPAVTTSGRTITVTGTYTSYQWYKSGTLISGATMNNYTYSSPGSYTVVVDSAGCRGTSTAVLYNVGVAQIADEANSFTVNRSGNGGFILSALYEVNRDLGIGVYDATGRRIFTDTWAAGTQTRQLATEWLAAGIYIIRIGNDNTASVLKVQK